MFTILAASLVAYYWYVRVLTNPDRILTGMVDKSLRTSAIDRTISQEQGDTSLNQTTRVSFTPQLLSRSDAILTERTSLGKTTIRTESIGTKDTDYVRYTNVEIENPNNQRNFKDVLGLWGKRQTDLEKGQQASFFDTAMFMAVPFGNLNDSQRKAVQDEISRVNLYQYKQAKLDFDDGRPTMRYTLALNPQSLVQVLAKYAEVTGVGNKTELDPAQYEGALPISIKLDVDVLSRHIKVIDFGSTGRTETYHTYSGQAQTQIPTQTIGVDELQQRLTKIEGGSQ